MSKLNNIGSISKFYSLEDVLDCLPKNLPLYNDSGLWQILTDEMEYVILSQEVNESLREFIDRYVLFLEEKHPKNHENFLIDISLKERKS